LECTLKPRKLGNLALIDEYAIFFSDPMVRMLAVSTATWEAAAELGGDLNLKAFDSLHLATAIEQKCDLFLTNDTKLTKCKQIAVEILK